MSGRAPGEDEIRRIKARMLATGPGRRRRNLAPPEPVVLTRPFDPWRPLPAGLYVASSTSGAFGPLLASIALGNARFEGEHMGPLGTKKILASGGRRPNPQIGISREFFTTVLREYRDWRIKWWREAIQNAADAGAKLVRLEVVQQPDGTFLVAADDDGSGMDVTTLVDKFLMLGATTKIGVEGVGGFGKAKELLILPWLSWRVHTLDKIAQGSGVQYELLDAPPRKGTRLEVVMPADQTTHLSAAMAFLGRSNIPGVRFELHDETGLKETMRATLRPRDLVDTVPDKAEIYATKVGYDAYQMYVRANGLYMFDFWIGNTGKKQLVVEITAPSVEILSANRDDFRDPDVRMAVARFGEELAKDTQSALARRAGRMRKKYAGKGKFVVGELQAAALSRLQPIPPIESGTVLLGSEEKQDIVEVVQHLGSVSEASMISAIPSAELSAELLAIRFAGAHHVEEAIRQLVWEPDFFIVNEVDDFRVPKKFLPETMTPRVLKLAKVWTELCRYVLMQLGSFQRYGVGFIFSHTLGAAYQPEDDEHWLLLNPSTDLYEPGKKTWSPSKPEDLRWLYAAAVHECTHMADGIKYHDESFAAALTRNVAKTAPGFRRVGAIVSKIRMYGAPSLRPQNPVAHTIWST